MLTKTSPQLTFQNYQGKNNSTLDLSAKRLIQANSFRDLSTVCIIPNQGVIPAKVVQNWMPLVTQMNQRFIRIMAIGMETNNAYNKIIEQILVNPLLASYKYILTLEENIVPPYDGLLRLFENAEKYDVIGGLVWAKGEIWNPMVYGNPRAFPFTFLPVPLVPDTVQECNGIGTGFTLFKLDVFKNPKVPKPWFGTELRREPGKKQSTIPDMSFFDNILKLGYKVACDTRVRAGNFDSEKDVVW